MKLNRNESNDSKNVGLSTQLIGTHSLYMYLAYAYTQYIVIVYTYVEYLTMPWEAMRPKTHHMLNVNLSL